MRLKAVPLDNVADTVKSHPVILIAALGGAAFLMLRAHNAGATSPGGTSDYAYSPIAYTAGNSSGIGSNASGSGSGVVDTSTSANGGVSNSTLFDFEKLKEQHSYDLALATLQQSALSSANQAAIAGAALQSSNYQALASVINSFLAIPASGDMNNYHSLFGSVSDSSGNHLDFNLGAIIMNKAGGNSAATAVENIKNAIGAQAAYVSQFGITGGNQSASGSGVGFAGGSAGAGFIAPTLAGYNGGQPPIGFAPSLSGTEQTGGYGTGSSGSSRNSNVNLS